MLLVVLVLLLRAQVLLEYRLAASRSLRRMFLSCHKAKIVQIFQRILIFSNTYSCHVGILLITGNLRENGKIKYFSERSEFADPKSPDNLSIEQLELHLVHEGPVVGVDED